MKEFLIADADLQDLDDLLSRLRPEVDVIRVGADGDPHAVLTDILATRPKAVHVLAHGAPGQINLGAHPINKASLADRAWPDAGGTDILIHACRVAEGEAGQRFLKSLAAATNANVAASSELVGHAKLGGSWVLNTTTAPVNTALPFVGAEAWPHVLAVTGTPSAGNDTLTSDNAADRIDGGAGNDVLIGNGDDDTLLGGADDDILNGGLGADILNGGAGFDQVTYENATAGLVLDLRAPANSTGEAAGDTFVDVERWIGSNFADRLVAGDQAVWFWGHDGDDVEVGGAGNDTLESGNGNDTIFGGGGVDEIYGRADRDTLYGEAGNDVIAGGGGEDIIYGGDGNDTIYGDWDSDTMFGGAGDDAFYAGEHGTLAEADVIDGGAGNDRYIITQNLDAGTVRFDGGADTDTLSIATALPVDIAGMRLTNVEALELSGATAHDVTLSVAQFNAFTSVAGGTGQDVLRVNLIGSDGAVNLSTRALTGVEQVQIIGTGGNDVITGTTTVDALMGGDGVDILTGGAGDDVLVGGAGIDVAVMSGARAAYTIGRANGNVTVTGGTEGTDTLNGVERVQFSDGTLIVDSSDPAFSVYRLYEAALNRAPDGPGLLYWVNAYATGLPMATMANQFMASPEFTTRFGAPNDAGFVDLLYRNVLDRPADGEGAAFWTDVLVSGRATRADVLLGFANSAENIAHVNTAVGDGIWFV